MLSSDEEEEVTEVETETRSLNAEEATQIATNFLKRLGNKQGLKPIKASLQEERYIIEVGLKNKTATVQINATNEEIKEYEIKAIVKESTSSFQLTRKNIIIICVIVAASIFVSSMLGIQSVLRSLLLH
jgi:hypothetical protein